MGVDFCYHELPEQLDEYDSQTFQRSGMPFYAVCTNMEIGRLESNPEKVQEIYDLGRADAGKALVSLRKWLQR